MATPKALAPMAASIALAPLALAFAAWVASAALAS